MDELLQRLNQMDSKLCVIESMLAQLIAYLADENDDDDLQSTLDGDSAGSARDLDVL